MKFQLKNSAEMHLHRLFTLTSMEWDPTVLSFQGVEQNHECISF